MAVSVTSDLVDISSCESLTDGGTWSRLSGTSSGNPASDNDARVQGNACVANKMGATTSADVGGHFNATAPFNATGKYLFYWRQLITPGNMLTKANAGVVVGLTSNSMTGTTWAPTDYARWNIDGSDTIPVAVGWVPYALDVASASDVRGGSLNLSAVRNIAFICRQSTGVTTTLSNQFVDAVRLGTGLTAVTSVGTDVITFDALFAVDGSASNRWGIITFSGGVYYAAAKINVGSLSQSQACIFTDSNQLIFWRQNRVANSFNELILRGASGNSTTFTLTGSVVRGAPWSLTAGANTTATLTGCALSAMFQATLTASSSLAGSTVSSSGQITSAGADLTGCSFSNHTGTQLRLTTGVAGLDTTRFTRGAGGHAIEITVPGAYSFPSVTFSGYGADGTTTAAVYNNSGGAVTLNLSGEGNLPTIRNGAGASTSVVSSALLTLTGLAAGSEVRAYRGTDPATATEIAGTESSGSSFNFSHDKGGQSGYLVVHALGYQSFRLELTYSASDQTIPIVQQVDRQYFNP